MTRLPPLTTGRPSPGGDQDDQADSDHDDDQDDQADNDHDDDQDDQGSM